VEKVKFLKAFLLRILGQTLHYGLRVVIEGI